jgi:hypothetical protein
MNKKYNLLNDLFDQLKIQPEKIEPKPELTVYDSFWNNVTGAREFLYRKGEDVHQGTPIDELWELYKKHAPKNMKVV